MMPFLVIGALIAGVVSLLLLAAFRAFFEAVELIDFIMGRR